MDLVNNKDFIVEEIERSAQLEIDRHRSSYEQERTALTASAEQALDRELESMKQEQQANVDALTKRMDSRRELAVKRIRLEAEAKLRKRVLASIHATLLTNNERSRSIAQQVVEDLKRREPVRIEGPLWLDAAEKTIDDFAFRAYLADGSYLEVTTDDIIERLEPVIREEMRAWIR